MSNLTDKRTEIVKGLEKVFPDREVTMKQLMEWAEGEGLSKYAPSFIWKSENKVRRGVFRIPEINGNVATDAKVAFVPMATEEKKEVALATNVIEFPKNETESYVPAKVGNYVKFGHYNDVKTIKKSGQFYPIFITGLSGNGKTMNVSQACAQTKRECIRVNITIETDEDDLLGGYRLQEGQTVWQNGPVVEAMERGALLLLDEIDLASNKIMCLQPILEGNGVFLKKINKFIKPAPGFNVIATANTKGQGSDDGKFIGTNILNEAFLERFPITVEQSYPTNKIENKILNNVFANKKLTRKADEKFATDLVTWADIIRKTFYDGGADEIISTRRLVHIAKAYSIFDDRAKAIDLCIQRFDDETKESFRDLYSKVDVEVDNSHENPTIQSETSSGSDLTGSVDVTPF